MAVALLILASPMLVPGAARSQGLAESCLSAAVASPPALNETVAAVVPLFTSTPYASYATSSFYRFFRDNARAVGNVTAGLGDLSTPVSQGMSFNEGWGNDLPISNFLTSQSARQCGLREGSNLMFLTDPQVDSGGLFGPGGKRLFDAAILGHEEYVTRNEYSQLERFVATGGRLVVLDGDALSNLVRFDGASETYVTGHGWTFGGLSAWKSPTRPFNASDTDWLGSVFCCFNAYTAHRVVVNESNPIGGAIWAHYGTSSFFSSGSLEQSRVTNLTGTSIIASFVDSPGVLIAAYDHQYRSGYVVSYSAYGTDSITVDPSVEYFVVQALAANLTSARPHPAVVTYPALPLQAGASYLPYGLAAVIAAFLISWRRSRVPAGAGRQPSPI